MIANSTDPVVAHALAMSGIESRILEPGEHLVGLGFRFWLSGYQDRDIGCWQHCWDYFCRELGGGKARNAVSDLSNWVNAVRCASRREIELLPPACRSFCRDECLAVTLVAASEHRACPALRVCAQVLLGTENTKPVLDSAFCLKRTLEACGVSLRTTLITADAQDGRH